MRDSTCVRRARSRSVSTVDGSPSGAGDAGLSRTCTRPLRRASASRVFWETHSHWHCSVFGVEMFGSSERARSCLARHTVSACADWSLRVSGSVAGDIRDAETSGRGGRVCARLTTNGHVC